MAIRMEQLAEQKIVASLKIFGIEITVARSAGQDIRLEELIETVIKPLFLAAGYTENTLNNFFK